MKKIDALKIAVVTLAAMLTGCAAADTSTTAAKVEMRVHDGYIQYYNGTDWENLISTEELKGEKGDKGDKGDLGEKGERGETGPQGAKGEKGDPGLNGSNGLNGSDGINGKDGANGQNGANGKNGADGKDGINGKDGSDGKDGRDGIDGKDGKDGLNGKDGADGKDGRDGVDGKDGLNGKDGKDGVNGKDGRDGIDGKDGKDGVDGKDGRDGIDGKDGKDGVDGKDGRDGVDGKDGKDGVDGKDGISSVPGITKEFRVSLYNYYDFFDSTSVCGQIQIDNIEKVVIDVESFYEEDSSKLRHISFLMNEDGQLSLTAVAEPGWSFVKWDDGFTEPSRTITYTDSSGLIAYFAPTDPVLDWDNIKPNSNCSAALTHPYSSEEPWIDVCYTCQSGHYTSSQYSLGGGLLSQKSEESIFGKYVDIDHSATTTIRYGLLSSFPSENVGASIRGRCSLSLETTNNSDAEFSVLRIQVFQHGTPVDPETVLPPLSSVDWLEQE